MPLRRLSSALLPVALSALLACGGGTVPAKDAIRDDSDTGTDTATDTGSDTATDTAVDTSDSGTDTSDTGTDTSDTGAQSEDCTDGRDNDADGAADCDDTDCASEDACTATGCWDTDLGSATGEAVASGTASGAGDDQLPSCDPRDATTEDRLYRWTAPTAGTWRASTVGSAGDTVLTAWTADCSGTELACDTGGVLERRLSAGATVLLGVDATGDYVLHIVPADTPETGCADGTDTDFDGLAGCDDDDCATVPGCAAEDCAGGVDEDGDGLTDCDDTDCTGDAACLPEGDCANGTDDDRDGFTDCDDSDCAAVAVCVPETDCTDGLDDDYDGDIDCYDSDCASAPECVGVCGDGDLGSATGASVASGTTTGEGDDSTPSCGSSTAEDVLYVWTAPASDTYTFTTVGSSFDTVLAVSEGSCASPSELDCNDDTSGTTSAVTATLVAGDVVYIDVDGYSTRSGSYILNIYGSTESDCADGSDDDGDGVADCDDSDCATSCPEDACADGLDDDGDGLADCDDSDCTADPACLEESDCTDGLDDDGDGLTDCDDPSCADDTYCLESACVDTDLGSETGTGVATGTTTGTGDDSTPGCGYSFAEDLRFRWTAPADDVYTFTTLGSAFDTILAVSSGDCSSTTELDCNDDTSGTTSEVTAALYAGDTVFIDVDGYSSGSGSYALNIHGTIESECDDGDDDDLDGLTDCDDSDCLLDSACP